MSLNLDKIEELKIKIYQNQNIVNDLDKSNDISHLPKFVLENAVKTIEEFSKIQILNNYQEILHMSGFSISWHYGDIDFIYGGCWFNSIADALIRESSFWKIDFSLPNDADVPKNLKHFEKLNWFEKQAWSDDWRYGCFIRSKGIFKPEIAFFDKNWYIRMNCTLEEYFEFLFNSMAVQGWQYFYIDWNQEIPHWKRAIKDMRLAVKHLPTIFPDKDFSYHAKKLSEVEQILIEKKMI